MTKIEQAIEFAKTIASRPKHGYDQQKRWGDDYDCSSFIITVWQMAGVPVRANGATYTGNMRSVFTRWGFDIPMGCDLVTGAGLQAGDVLLNEENHTAMYIGNGQLVQASINELGKVTGGMTGDQTGKEIGIVPYYSYPWDCVLRYVGDNTELVSHDDVGVHMDEGELPATYTVQKGDTLQGIAIKLFGDWSMWKAIAEINHIGANAFIYPGQVLKLYDDGCTECAFDGVEAPTSPVTPSEIGGYTEYTVKAGDSLWAIADRSGDFRRWEELAKLNDIYEPFTIYVGQKIKIPKEWV